MFVTGEVGGTYSHLLCFKGLNVVFVTGEVDGTYSHH
jgi:hypothetical protein